MVILPLILLVVRADSSDKQDVKTKTSSPALNTIPQSPKYETFFQPIRYQQQQQVQQIPQHFLQSIQHIPQFQQFSQKPQYVPVQLVPKQYYLTQPQQHAMIIIAQPTLLPQSLVYGNPTQQLLNYFNSNPQAKYQLLHGNYQQQTQQSQSQQPQSQQPQSVQPTPTFMHHLVAPPTLGTYILTPTPQLQPIPVAHQIPYHQALTQRAAAQAQAQHAAVQAQAQAQQSAPQTAPGQSSSVTAPASHYSSQQQTHQLGNIAHLAQLAAQQYGSNQLKTAPAIVTGFEHFTPEQQAQIKAQLAMHLGTNFHAVSNPVNQYSAKYVAQQDSNDFVPSPQIKSNEQVTTVSSTNESLKSRYVKNKN